MSIQVVTAKAFYAPTARRRFFTRKAALHAEASAVIQRKYPTERQEDDGAGRITYGGWHWSEDERLCRLHKRLIRILASATP